MYSKSYEVLKSRMAFRPLSVRTILMGCTSVEKLKFKGDPSKDFEPFESEDTGRQTRIGFSAVCRASLYIPYCGLRINKPTPKSSRART